MIAIIGLGDSGHAIVAYDRPAAQAVTRHDDVPPVMRVAQGEDARQDIARCPRQGITSQLPFRSRAINRFTYAIRNIVAEAQRVEAAGTRVRYLNIGDPVAFGFQTPRASDRRGRAGAARRPQRLRSVGRHRAGARSGRARIHVARLSGRRRSRAASRPARRKAIELALSALVDDGEEVLVPMPTYPLYTAVLAKIGAQRSYYRTDPARGWMPDLDHLESLVTPATRVLVVIDPNNPTGAAYSRSTRRALLDFAERHGLVDSRRRGLRRSRLRRPGRRRSAASIPTRRSSRSRACRRRISRPAGAPAGWRSGASPRLDDVAGGDQEAGGRATVQHRADAVRGAERADGDRSHRSRSAPRSQERAALTMRRAAMRSRASAASRPPAAFYAMPRVALPPGTTDEEYVLGAAARDRRAVRLRLRDSACRPADGFLRIVFLASPDELRDIYDADGDFTRDYRRGERDQRIRLTVRQSRPAMLHRARTVMLRPRIHAPDVRTRPHGAAVAVAASPRCGPPAKR